MKIPALALALAAVSCGGPEQRQVKLNRWGKPFKEGIVAPAWVDKIPESGTAKLYGVGFSGPTYWPQDALNNAGESARGKLALALASHVEFLGMDAASQGGATINKEATDVVMQNSRIEATWVDENGECGEPASVWALASIELDAARGRAAPVTGAVWTSGTRQTAPSWLDRLPGSKSKVFAAGYSGPTFRADDAVKYASDNAVASVHAPGRKRLGALGGRVRAHRRSRPGVQGHRAQERQGGSDLGRSGRAAPRRPAGRGLGAGVHRRSIDQGRRQGDRERGPRPRPRQ